MVVVLWWVGPDECGRLMLPRDVFKVEVRRIRVVDSIYVLSDRGVDVFKQSGQTRRLKHEMPVGLAGKCQEAHQFSFD